jgi:predicted transcriptional regulator YdeE
MSLFLISIVIAGCVQQTRQEIPKEQLSQGKSPMEPKIVKRGPFKFIGVLKRINPQNDIVETYVAIWNQFESYRNEIEPKSIDKAYYGVSLSMDKKGVFDYLAGMAVSKESTATEGLAVYEIPTAVYAIFECPVEKIADTKQFIFQKWLPHSKYEINGMNPVFEKYSPAGETDSTVRIHIPIKDKATSK